MSMYYKHRASGWMIILGRNVSDSACTDERTVFLSLPREPEAPLVCQTIAQIQRHSGC